MPDPVEETTRHSEQHPHDLQALADRAEACLERRDFKAALGEVERCLEIAGGDSGLQGDPRATLLARLYRLRAGALAGLGDWQGASQAVQMALRERPDDVETIVQRGRIRLELGGLPGALQDVERALALDSGSAGAYLVRCAARYRLREYEGALQDCDRAIQLDRTLAAAWSQRGQVHFALDNLHQAGRDCRTALEMDPQLIPAYDVLAGCLLQQKKPDEALDVVAEGLRRCPGDTALRLRAARIYVEQELFPQALAVLDVVLRRSPDHGEAYGLRGSVHSRCRDYAAAIADLRRAIQLDPQTAAYYYDLALAYWHTGEMAAALGCLQEVLRLRPGDVEARALYHQLGHQGQAQRAGNPPADEGPEQGFDAGTLEGA